MQDNLTRLDQIAYHEGCHQDDEHDGTCKASYYFLDDEDSYDDSHQSTDIIL